MGLKSGYKLTEVGIIPVNWAVTRLGFHGETYGGLTGKAKKDFGSGNAHYVTFMNVMSNVIVDPDCFERVHVAITESQNLVQRSDLLFNGSSETPDEVALCAVVLHDVTELYLNSFCFGFRLQADKSIDPIFLAYLFRSQAGRKLVKALAQGSTRYNISKGALLGAQLALPPLHEQRVIATSLTDIDALLESLDRLIAKKRDLKQAAMQQLLTGQTRLPGFSGEWEVKRLGDLGATYGGLTGKTKADFGNGEARYITFMNVMQNVVIDSETFDRVEVLQMETQNRARKGDLFFNGSSETPEEVAMCAVLLDEVQDVYLNSFCFGFRFREDVAANEIFFAYYLRGPVGRELMKSLAQGSTRYNLSKVALLNSSLSLPTPLEQAAIAEVLTVMDTELVALEQRRNKTAALKQGMMQELLTGRTRLV